VSKKDNTCLITGAAGGIGRALAKVFVDAGFCVIAIDSVSDPKNICCNHYLQVDLSKTVYDKNYANNIFDCLSKIIKMNGLSVLINNAAVQILGGVDSLTRENWQHTLSVNLLAPFIWVQALLPHIESVCGCIINISSIHARLTKKNYVAYATSKAALSGMTRAMAVDLEARVRVNAIEPAAIDTDMLKAGFEKSTEAYQQLQKFHPMQRIGTPEEVARAALWLSSSSSAFIHGECLSLDGGISKLLHDPC
jgi:NAD(P)-dependent dehydrogenase (short-subunit alcohol dehydrogenase family)